MLKPEDTIHRFLISTPSRLVGEYISEDLIINHAWRSEFLTHHSIEGPFSKSYYMVSLKLENQQEDALMIPDISIEPLITWLSVLFGKRFENHGPVQQNGLFRIPDLGEQKPLRQYKLGFINHQPRSNLGVALDLTNFQIMKPLSTDKADSVDKAVIPLFNTAGKFYLRALQTYDTNPENAYLDLITCGEILSNHFTFEDEQMYDSALLKMFEEIEGQTTNGKNIVKNIKKRLYQVKRRFTFTILKLLTPDFYEAHEVPNGASTYASLTLDNIEARIKAAYDLRSMYVHTGIRFGKAISFESYEVPIGTWTAVEGQIEKNLLKSINQAPTFKGLERIIRFCLLQFLHTNNVINLAELPQINEPATE